MVENWSFDIYDNLEADNNYTIISNSIDLAGNISDNSTTQMSISVANVFIPSVKELYTNTLTPKIEGNLNTSKDGTITNVIVNGKCYCDPANIILDTAYTVSYPLVVVNNDSSWYLDIPSGHIQSGGVYDVIVSVKKNNITFGDITTNELNIRENVPLAPTVNYLETNNSTPTITGDVDKDSTLKVTINGIEYSNMTFEDDPNSSDRQLWSLIIPEWNSLADGEYNINAESSDDYGNNVSVNNKSLVIDTIAPDTPIISNMNLYSSYPSFSGSADVETVQLELNGEVYTTIPSNGDWSIKVGNIIPRGTYDALITYTDKFGNSSTLTESVSITGVPEVNKLYTNLKIPTLSGNAFSTDVLKITVDGVVYEEGDGNLVDSGNDTWSLKLPNELNYGVYSVSIVGTDSNGVEYNNVVKADDLTIQESFNNVNLPTVNDSKTYQSTPMITGTYDSSYDNLKLEIYDSSKKFSK